MQVSTGNGTCFEDYGNSALLAFKVLQDMTLLLGIVANCTLVFTICCCQQLRETTHVFIASLAISDIIFCCHGIRYTMVNDLSEGDCDTNDFKAKNFIFLSKVSSAANYANILMVSIERWLYIARPFLHQRYLSKTMTAFGLATVWLLAIIANIDTFIVADNKYLIAMHFKLNVMFPFIHFFVSFILCIVYLHLAIIARGQLRAINRTRPMAASNCCTKSACAAAASPTMASIVENLKSLRLLVLVFGSFFALMTPGICLHLYDTSDFAGLNHPFLHDFFKQMTFTHSCINFFVFATQNRHFRQIFLGYFRNISSWFSTCCCRQPCSVETTPNVLKEINGDEPHNPTIKI